MSEFRTQANLRQAINLAWLLYLFSVRLRCSLQHVSLGLPMLPFIGSGLAAAEPQVHNSSESTATCVPLRGNIFNFWPSKVMVLSKNIPQLEASWHIHCFRPRNARFCLLGHKFSPGSCGDQCRLLKFSTPLDWLNTATRFTSSNIGLPVTQRNIYEADKKPLRHPRNSHH